MEFCENEQGFFEIRLESIGGQGAYSAGQMLAEIGVSGSDLQAICFADYGSEKKGAPVKTFIRFAANTKKIRNYAPIETPKVVVVFHEHLANTLPITNGLDPQGILIINTKKSPQEMRDILDANVKTIVTVDGIGIAVEEKTKANTAVLGAVFRALPFLKAELAEQSIEKMFGYKYPHLVLPNVHTFKRGMDEAKIENFAVDQNISFQRQVTPFGYETQLLGGIIEGANSFKKNLSASREGYIPAWDAEKCTHCANCDNVCPDFCFVWETGEDKRGREQNFLTGIDYNYCKGCLKCIEVCPSGALTALLELGNYAEERRKPKPIILFGGEE